jgi:DNA-directed RNA polymerase specialized sigma24 family protein
MDLHIYAGRDTRMREARTDDEAGRALTRGDFTSLVERHERELLGFLYGLAGEAELARDLLQDTFYDA